MNSFRIDPQAIKAGLSNGKASTVKGLGSFSTVMGAAQKDVGQDVSNVIGIAGNTAGTTASAMGSPNAAAVLYSSMTAIPEAFAAGTGKYYGGYTGGGSYGSALGSTPGMSKGDSASAGGLSADLSPQELMQSMNANSMKLLVLQAQIQDHSQATNMRSNIMTADHRAKSSIIEKFTGRSG